VQVKELSSRRLENIVTRASELIGRTPLFELCSTESGSRLLLKLEQFNPTGSAKVRMAEQMIINAELGGQLRPGGHIIEPTSGNTGLGLALVAIERGYRFTAVVDHHASIDKLRVMAAMGAELVERVDGRYRNSDTAQECLVSGGPVYLGDTVMATSAKHYRLWGQLTEALRDLTHKRDDLRLFIGFDCNQRCVRAKDRGEIPQRAFCGQGRCRSEFWRLQAHAGWDTTSLKRPRNQGSKFQSINL